MVRYAVLIVAGLMMWGCGAQPRVSRTYDTASLHRAVVKSPLRKTFYTKPRLPHGASAFYPLPRPDDALAARLWLIDHAVSSLDVQYYIFENDTIGRLIAAHLYRAAERGVRVRIVLDDLSTTGKDAALLTLAHHPNIHIKLFNPNRWRGALRSVALVCRLERLGKRMHNKALIADNLAAIVGGRNIADVYFADDNATLFLDDDNLAVGSVVQDIGKSFERYYSSTVAVPVGEVIDTAPLRLSSKELTAEDHRFWHTPLGQALRRAPFVRALRHKTLQLIVADKTRFYDDDPSKVTTDKERVDSHIAAKIDPVLLRVDREVVIVSPYFIPSASMLDRFKKWHEEGKQVVVITNSLASTDVFAVYSGYQGYMKRLLDSGVALYELKPDGLRTLRGHLSPFKRVKTSLHTKMILFDDDRIMVGSANIDPRSNKLNTELVLFIASKPLQHIYKKMIKQALRSGYFYRVGWGRRPYKQNGVYREGPVWYSTEGNRTHVYYRPPHVGFGKQFLTDLLALLPIEGYL